MKLPSFNCRGVANPSNKISLRRLVELSKPDILLLQETLGELDSIIPLLEILLKQWKFFGIDSKGHSGGLAIGWNTSNIKLINSWGFDSCIGININLEDLGRSFTISNICGPTQGRIPFWDNLLNKYFLKSEYLIIGGDLNFSQGLVES